MNDVGYRGPDDDDGAPSPSGPPRASRDRQGAGESKWPGLAIVPVRLPRSLTVAARTIAVPSSAARAGFTLVEVAAVTLVLALLAAGVALSFAGPLRAVRAGDAVERVRAFDTTARLAARRSGRAVRMTYDGPDAALVRRDDIDDRGGGGAIAYRGSLPGGYRIDHVRSAAEGAAGDGSGGGGIGGAGRFEVDCAPGGLTRTYAVRVVGPGLDRWIVFAGLTGQVTEARDESDVETIFAVARRPPVRD